MKPLTVTYGPSWPGHTALPADGTQVGTVRFRATARLADGTGATIGEINGRLVVVAGQIVVKGATNALSLKLLGSTRADGSPRAPRYEVREILTLDGRDIPQTFVIEPYEDAAVADTWDYRSPPVQGLTYVGQLPLSLEQAQQYALDFQAAADSINDALADAQAAAGYRPAAQQAAGYLDDAQEAAGYLAPLAAAKDQADQDHTRAATDHQQVVDNLAGIAQAQQGVEASRVTLEAQTAQATQQAASVSLMQQAVASEAALAGKPAGNYPVLDTSRIVTWDGGDVTFRGPELATVATSVARVPDIATLSAYNGTALTVSVDDPLRGGMFTRALASIAGAADDVMRVAHSSGTYVWVRRVGGVYLTSWARVPHAGGDNYAPYLQRLFNACPRGGVIENNVRAAAALAYWPVAPWARPDGKTDTILTLDRTVELRWGGNQYSGYLGYDTRTPGDVDVMQVSSMISTVPDFAGNSTEYGMRLYDLAILPTTGSPCARHALHLMPTAQNNLADMLINGGQFVATNPDGRAIYSNNSGNNGMFALRIHDVKLRGGAQLIKLGDSCEIVRGLWAGHAGSPALYVSLLDPTNPTDAAAQLVIRSLNINALGGGVVVEDAATTVIEGLNCEVRNRHEGGAANYGQYAVILRRCGTKGGHAGESARAYSGSRFVVNKVLPADGGSYDSSSGGYAVLFDECRGWYIAGGALGTSQVLGPDNTPAANGLSVTLRASDDMVVDMVDLQLTTNGIGLDIEPTTKNTRIRGLSINPIVPTSWQAVRDNGQGTMGLAKVWTPHANYTVQPGYELMRLLKDESGMVHLTATLVPATGQADVPVYHPITTLPVGFTPTDGEQVRRMVGIEHRGLVEAHPTYRRWASYPARVLSAADGGQVQINSRTQEAVDDDLPITQATMISVELSWYAPRVP